MVKYQYTVLGCLLNLGICLWSIAGMAQTDKWIGTWQLHYKPWPHIPPIVMELAVAEPVKGMLYPAKLKLSYQDFSGEYELLLVKKNDHELGIGRNKYPKIEQPYGLGPWMLYLNGVLHYQPGTKVDSIKLQRIWMDNFGVFMHGIYDNELYTNKKSFIRDFLYKEPITLLKKDGIPWRDPHIARIVNTDTIFYGVYDPIEVTVPNLQLSMQDEEHYDRDSITLVHNAKVLANGLALEQATKLNEITLDSGENYIAFFADNYGDIPPNTANFLLTTSGKGGGRYAFNFADKANAFSTVMVARFQYEPQKVADKEEPAMLTGDLETRTAGRRDLPIGSLKVNNGKLTLAVWDEQVEDGDIISLYVNDVKLVKDISVRKRAKQFTVNLQPGRNRILFFAENLGLIAPNTAAIRIKSGDIEKSLYLNTDLEQNNLLEIVWDERPESMP